MKKLITLAVIALSLNAFTCTIETFNVDGKLYLSNGKGASEKFLNYVKQQKCVVKELQASKEFKDAILAKKIERSNNRMKNLLAKLAK